MSIAFVDILPLISSLLVIGLGVFVAIKRKDRISFTFFLHALSISVWLFGTFMMFISKNDHQAVIFWDRILYKGVVFIPVMMYHFGLAFTKKKADLILYFGYFLSICFFIASQTPYFVDGVFIYKWGVHTRAQIFHHMFLGYFLSYVFIWFYKIIKYYRPLKSGKLRDQTKYIMIGFLLLFSIGPLAYLPAYGIGIYPFAYFSGLIFTAVLAYAIVRHRLMDIKVVMRASTVYLSSIVTVIVGVMAIRFLFLGEILNRYIIVDVITLIVAVSAFPIVRKYYYRFSNQYLFSSLYDPQEVIAEISEELSTTLDDKKMFRLICDTSLKAFHVEAVGIIIYEEDKNRYRLGLNRGFKVGNQKYFDADPRLEQEFIRKNQVVITEEVASSDKTKKSPILQLMLRLKVEMLAPLMIGRKNLGLLVLGAKESRDAFNTDDIATIDVIRAQAAVAIQNALSYREIKDFSNKLEREVKAATRELRTANAKLKKLDKAKSEFISIASHQLRTPLTSIKGFISLLLEDAYGKVKPEQKKIMHKVFISNERLILLVEDLLNVSRIERGKMEYDFEKVSLVELIDSAINLLQIQADNKKLYLKFKNKFKKADLPFIEADPKKMSEVVGNLIDNAIKYTHDGGITVTLEPAGKQQARIVVSDTGIGIEPEVVPQLFEKFSRGDGAGRVHTGGTGLGLYVAKKLTEAHKGKIWVQSRGKGEGSKFFVELPLVQVEADTAAVVKSEAEPGKAKAAPKTAAETEIETQKAEATAKKEKTTKTSRKKS